MQWKRIFSILWLACICVFAALHALHLRADFPNGSPWHMDWAKYTDEGWYGNAAIRQHLFGHWYIPGDFNPAPAVPVLPLLEYLLFSITGVSIEAARSLAVAFFFLNLALSYKLLRERSPRWAALLALTLLVTSPFLYSFSRLAILEPLLTTLALLALNIAIRLPRTRRMTANAALIGLLFTLMMFTKATAIFLLPAFAYAALHPLWPDRKKMLRATLAAAITSITSGLAWFAVIVTHGWLADYKYFFFINDYKKPHGLSARLMSFWWSLHGSLWIDWILIPLAGLVLLLAILARKQPWARALWQSQVFVASLLAIFGYIFFMTYQNHPQPRYFAVVAFFAFFLVAIAAGELLPQSRKLGIALIALTCSAIGINSLWTLSYVTHPTYTWVTAAENLTHYIDAHPNGKRLLVSISGDEITLITHLPTLCDDFGTEDLIHKTQQYQPGWYASWNDLDPGTLEDLHAHYRLEQVAGFPAMDDKERNVLYLFKLHPLKDPEGRDSDQQKLNILLPDDKVTVDVE